MSLYTGSEWTFERIEQVWGAINKIGSEELGLEYYDPQIEMITSEQMLDACSSHAMPVMYNHWSFGKNFVHESNNYKAGRSGLAYEVVINTDPCIAYLMEDNSMTMQTLVLSHAVCGHGSFFKNNYLFKYWTDATAILDYLVFAQKYIQECETKYGAEEVELFLDACHAIQYYGVDKYKRPSSLKKETIQLRKKMWNEYVEESFDDLWRTLPKKRKTLSLKEKQQIKYDRGFPEENVLYFIEKRAPYLNDWQRELVRIVRKISQYFYPQMQTKMMNEGWASFVHYEIMTRLHDQELIDEGSYLEFLKDHTAVCCQPDFDSDYYSGLNVYALGFAIFSDLKRMCVEPDEEDLKWFPDICNTDWKETLKGIVEDYRDESFILQFLSPKVIRKFKLFSIHDDNVSSDYKVVRIHDDDDVYKIRKQLSNSMSLSYKVPQIEVTGVDIEHNNELQLRHVVYEGRKLKYFEAKRVMDYIRHLWGAHASLMYTDPNGDLLD